jgi:cyanophycin synthetase
MMVQSNHFQGARIPLNSKPSSEFIGYKIAGAQPHLNLTLEMDEINNTELFAELDLWLAKAFGINTSVLDSRCGSSTVDIVYRATVVALELLRGARIPVFDPATIVGHQRLGENLKSRYKIVLGLPWIDHLPAGIASEVLSFCIKMLIEIMRILQQGKYPNIEEVRLLAEKNIIKKITSLIYTGVSTLPILNEAWKRGIPFRHISGAVFQLGWGTNSRLILRSSLDTDSAIGSALARVKSHTSHVLRLAGLPSPIHEVVVTKEEALLAAKKLGWPVVIKPNDRERSEGVTIGIYDTQSLEEAFKSATRYSKSILVEQQISGTCYRLMIANNHFLYALWRKPVSVIGNGKDSIITLLESAKNETAAKPNWHREKSIPLDSITHKVLASQGLTASSIPKHGQKVLLRFIESTEWGEDRGDATLQAHPENIDLAERAARVLGLVNAGIDIISENIGVPWHVNGAVINEVNYSPHFGGTEVARSRIPDFMDNLIEGDGRIPIEVFLGADNAWKAALERQKEWIKFGKRAWVTDHSLTVNHKSSVVHYANNTSFERTLNLLSEKQVDSIAIVLNDGRWLESGSPVDRIDAWYDFRDVAASNESLDKLARFLQNLTK